MFVSSRNRATFKDLHAPVVEYRRGLPAEHRPACRPDFRRLAPTPQPSHAIRSRRLGEKSLLLGPSADILSAAVRLDCFRNEKHGPWPCRSLSQMYIDVYTHVRSQMQVHASAAHFWMGAAHTERCQPRTAGTTSPPRGRS